MTEDECRKITQRCIDTWPNGPKGYIWREAIIELDYGPAVGAYRALLREAEKAPTPARFLSHYNSLTHSYSTAGGIRWNGDEISHAEYLERLAKRAANGSTAAQEELDRWERWLTPKRPA